MAKCETPTPCIQERDRNGSEQKNQDCESDEMSINALEGRRSPSARTEPNFGESSDEKPLQRAHRNLNTCSDVRALVQSEVKQL